MTEYIVSFRNNVTNITGFLFVRKYNENTYYKKLKESIMSFLKIPTNETKNKDNVKTESGIRGWLFIPAVSMLTIPLFLLSLILMNIKMINDPSMAAVIGQYPGLKAALVSQTLLVTLQLFFVLYVSFLFFKRKQSLPKMMIGFLTMHMLIMLANVSWISFIFKEINMPENIGVVSAILLTGSGIPYFIKSRRVKETFINH